MRHTAILLLLVACAGAPDGAPAGQDVGLPAGDQEVTLAIGETRQLPGGASLALTAVPADSRCPRNVVCVWAGSVAATLRLGVGSTDTTATINSLSEPRAFAFRGWHATLKGVTPDPDAGVPTPPDSYRVTVLVGPE
jgi:hypothetical protein